MSGRVLSRRAFFGLTASAAAASLLPKSVLALASPPAVRAIEAAYRAKLAEIEPNCGIPAGLYSIPYWQTVSVESYLGLERTAK